MAISVDSAFNEFMRDYVNLDPSIVQSARNSRDNLLDRIKAFDKTANYCYTKGKQLAVILACLLIILPIVINLSIQFVNNEVISGILIVISLIDFIVGEIIKQQLNKAKFNGAGMQQYFDEFVFNLKNSSKKYLAPKKLSLEERSKLIRKYEAKDNSPFYNWYSDYSALSYEQAVYNCQKENIRWDISIRKKYRSFLIILASLTVIVIAISAILQRIGILNLQIFFRRFYENNSKTHRRNDIRCRLRINLVYGVRLYIRKIRICRYNTRKRRFDLLLRRS